MPGNYLNKKTGSVKTLPRRSLGQNFLLDKNLAGAIAADLGFSHGDWVVEIGPGRGALTAHLLENPPAKFLAIEKDNVLAEQLGADFPGIEIRNMDALEFDPPDLWNGRPVCLIGNLPYNAGTAILQHFLRPDSPVRRAVVMLQKEVAQRICAKPGGGDYGALTVLLGSRWDCKITRIVPPSVFYPRPAVDSAVVRLERKSPAEIMRCAFPELERRVRQGFSQRRKQLKNLLGVDEERFGRAAEALGFPATARAQELSIAQWSGLAAMLADRKTDFGHNEHLEIFDVVDEEDRVVESLPRAEVHRRYLRHRAAHILIFNSGKVFLQRRAPWKDINPDVWDSSAAGHVDSGEGYEVCAHRELHEELGVRARLERIGRLVPCAATGNEFIEIFAGNSAGPFHPNPWEIEGSGFFEWPRVRRWAEEAPGDFSPVFLECLKVLDGAGFVPPA